MFGNHFRYSVSNYLSVTNESAADAVGIVMAVAVAMPRAVSRREEAAGAVVRVVTVAVAMSCATTPLKIINFDNIYTLTVNI